MINKNLFRQNLGLLLIVIFMTGCAGAPTEPPTTTPLPTTGTITGMMIDVNGKSLVSAGETGYIALYCADDNVGVECLHEGYEDMDPSALLTSICDITNRDDSCLLHLMFSAADVGWDGKYTIPFVHPGKYDLILIVDSGGILMTAHLLNVEPVQAGQVTKYDFPTE